MDVLAPLKSLESALRYLKARLLEHGSWVAMGSIVASTYMFPKPWNYVAIAFGILGVLVPNGQIGDKSNV